MAWENVYFIATLSTVVLYFLLHFSNIKITFTTTIPINILFSAFITLRDLSIGVDAQSYYDFFDFRDININEPLFNIIKLLHFPPELILFIISFCATSFVFIYFKNFSNRPYLIMGLYICTFVFLNTQINIIRQGLAMGFFHLSLVYSYKRNFPKYLFFAVVACITHYSSIIIQLFYLLGRWLFERTNHFIFILILVSTILYVLDFSSAIVSLSENYGLGTVSWYLSMDFGKPWEVKHVFFILIPLSLYAFYISGKFFVENFQIPLVVLLSIFAAAMLFKQGDMFADRLIYYSVPSFIVLFDVFLQNKVKYSSVYIAIGSVVWLGKTSYFQLPSWFIYYG